MAYARIVINDRAVRDMLKSQRVVDHLREHGEAIASAAGSGYAVGHVIGKTRAVATVITETATATRRESSTHALLRATQARGRAVSGG